MIETPLPCFCSWTRVCWFQSRSDIITFLSHLLSSPDHTRPGSHLPLSFLLQLKIVWAINMFPGILSRTIPRTTGVCLCLLLCKKDFCPSAFQEFSRSSPVCFSLRPSPLLQPLGEQTTKYPFLLSEFHLYCIFFVAYR